MVSATVLAKLRAVEESQISRNLSELRSFLGFAFYYRRFIREFATAGLMHWLLKNERYDWMKDYYTAFDYLKIRLVRSPVLALPLPGEQFIVEIDAGGSGENHQS